MRKVKSCIYTGPAPYGLIHVCRQWLVTVQYIEKYIGTVMSCFVLLWLYHRYFIGLLQHFPLWARGPQRLGWGAELTHTATGEW